MSIPSFDDFFETLLLDVLRPRSYSSTSFAESNSDSVLLSPGGRLTSLVIEHNVGMREKRVVNSEQKSG